MNKCRCGEAMKRERVVVIFKGIWIELCSIKCSLLFRAESKTSP